MDVIYRVLDSPTTFTYAIVLADGMVQEEATLKRIRRHAGNDAFVVQPTTRDEFNARFGVEQMYDVEIHFTLPAKDADAALEWVQNALRDVLEDGMPDKHDWWSHEDSVREVPHGHDFA